VAAIVATVIGVPIMRLSGLPAGIATLAILVIVNTVLGQWQSVTNGLQPFAGIPLDATLSSTLPYVLIAIPIAYLFKQSRIGLRLQASREDDVAARSIGVGVIGERTVAFVLSAAIVGAAGALYAHFLGSITPSVFYFPATFLLLTMLVVGGMKSLGGAILGAVVITALTEVLGRIENSVASLQGMTDVALALLLILILIIRPRGLTMGREFRMPATWFDRQPPFGAPDGHDSLLAEAPSVTQGPAARP
jgi:branched-chain amino acid transport system permease protein